MKKKNKQWQVNSKAIKLDWIQACSYYLLALLLVCISLASQAEIYKWTDADGKTHYGDRPQGNSVEEITIKSLSNEARQEQAEIQFKQQKYLDYLEEERLDRAQDREEKQQLLAERKKICEEAREYEKDLNTLSEFYRLNDAGEKEFLTNEEKEQEKDTAKKYIKEYCYN